MLLTEDRRKWTTRAQKHNKTQQDTTNLDGQHDNLQNTATVGEYAMSL